MTDDTQQQSQALSPEDTGTLGGAVKFILQKFLQGVDDMLPATVIAVDEARQYATVQPLVMVLGTNGSTTTRAQVAKVPILNAGAGGFVISFPVKAGDFGWIKANDRDISLFLQSNANAAPNTNRLHSFESGVFIPDAMRQWTLAAEDQANAVWQSYDGTTKVVLAAGLIKIVHPTKVRVESPLVEMTGNLVVTGTVTGKTDVKAGSDNISGKGHTHGGVTVGGGHTATPDA